MGHRVGKWLLMCCLMLSCLSAMGQAKEFLPVEWTFAGAAGSMPAEWRAVRKVMSGSGLTTEVTWEGNPVFRVISGAETAILHSPKYMFPKSGYVCFSVWARATQGTALLDLRIIGDNYESKAHQRVRLTEAFQKVSVELQVPRQIKNNRLFWLRIDVPEGGNDFLIGKVKTELAEQSILHRFIPWERTFAGQAGGMPKDWRMVRPGLPGTALTGDFTWNGQPVLRIRSGEKEAIAHSPKYAFPVSGIIRFSVWARAVSERADMHLYIIGDNYERKGFRQAKLTESFQKVSVELRVPESVTYDTWFWFRIDAPKGGNDFLVGKVKTELLPAKDLGNQEGNLLSNGSFYFGSTGYHRHFYQELVPNQPAPKFGDRSCILSTPYSLFADSMVYKPGQVYTGVARMRSAIKGKMAKATLLLLPYHYRKYVPKYVRLTDEFQTFFVQGSLPPSRYNRMSFRVDPTVGSIEVERLQLTAGKHQDFLPLPAVELGQIGRNTFDLGEADSQITLRVLQHQSPQAEMLAVEIRDSFGKVVKNASLPIPASPDATVRLPVNTACRGVFGVSLKFRGQTGSGRYAVMKNLQGMSFPQNALAGHFQPLRRPDTDLFLRYIPIDPNVNRSFMSHHADGMKQLETEEFQAYYRNFPCKNLICLQWKELAKDGFGTLLENNITPELEQKMMNYVERFAKIAGKCNFYGVELFNEPHLWKDRTTGKVGAATMPPEKVAYLYQKAYPIIKKYAPNLKIVGPCTHFAESRYNERFLKAGGARCIDMFSFHGYNEDADADGIAEENLELHALVARYNPKIPIINTEVYYGVRNHARHNSDEENRRVYCKDSELEQACAYASFYANSVLSAVPFCAFPLWFCQGVPFSDQFHLLVSGAALNAGIEFLGNAGAGGKIIPLDDQLRCFLFPNAPGGAVATLRGIPREGGNRIRARIPQGVAIYDLFGNPVTERTITLDSPIHYLKFPAGMKAESLLRNLPLAGLSFPLEAKLAVRDLKTLAVKLRNRGRYQEEITVTLKKYPQSWIPEQMVQKLTIKPMEEKLIFFAMKQFSLKDIHAQQVILSVATKQASQDFLRSLNAFPVRFSQNLTLQENDYIFLGQDNLSPVFDKRPNQGNADCSAKIGGVWNDKGLLLSVITEDDCYLPPTNYSMSYRHDSLQLYFDMKNDSKNRKQRKNKADDLVYQIGEMAKTKRPYAFLEFAEGIRYIGEANATTGLDAAVKVTVTPGKGKGRHYQIFLPQEALYLVPMKAGTVCGFSMLVNDNDGAGRKQGITFTPKGTEPFGNSHLWKDLVLIEAPADK